MTTPLSKLLESAKARTEIANLHQGDSLWAAFASPLLSTNMRITVGSPIDTTSVPGYLIAGVKVRTNCGNVCPRMCVHTGSMSLYWREPSNKNTLSSFTRYGAEASHSIMNVHTEESGFRVQGGSVVQKPITAYVCWYRPATCALMLQWPKGPIRATITRHQWGTSLKNAEICEVCML